MASLAQAPFTAVAASAEYATDDGYAFGRATDARGDLIGFTTTDDGGLGFWTAYQQLGGRAVLGAAISDRFVCDDTICQAFERALLRWDNAVAQVAPVPVLDEVHARGEDELVRRKLEVPPPGDSIADASSAVGLEPALSGFVGQLGNSAHLLVGTPRAIADTPLGRVLRGSSGAVVVSPDGSPYLLGAGAIAAAAGLVPDAALQMKPLPASSATQPGLLWIPRIDLRKPLVAKDPEADGYLPAPDGPAEVVWYTSAASLNEGGTMVLAGHVDWVTGGAAFFHLSELQPGDDIFIADDAGQQAHFRVISAALDDGDSPAVRRAITNSGIGPATLTLITCGGPFDVATRTYLQRLIVQAVRVE